MGDLVLPYFSYRILTKILCRTALLMSIAVVLVACNEEVRERPYGYLRLGHVKDFPEGETFLADKRFLIRHDSRGLSAMSTLCTHDLSPLLLQGDGSFITEFNPSRYAHDGRVLRGPAKKSLPFYRLVIDRDDIDKPREYLFIEVGKDVSADWRLDDPLLRSTMSNVQQ